MARILGLDPGDRRVGVAVSDELGLLARPYRIFTRSNRQADLETIAALVQEFEPSEVVIGMPLLPSGARGAQAEKTERLAGLIRERLSIPVVLWNESYSTVEALRRRAEARGRRRRSGAVDAEAAAVILQDYLDRHDR